ALPRHHSVCFTELALRARIGSIEIFRGREAVRVLADRLQLLAGEDNLPVSVPTSLRNLPSLPPTPQRLPYDAKVPMDIRACEVLDPVNLNRHGTFRLPRSRHRNAPSRVVTN